ncbi:MAG TPA: hypothetical protein VHW00_09480 [Thermoanaerobaculia bacterium]|nr:hypothetical protein [Thermoanaerobaculia bacterium]
MFLATVVALLCVASVASADVCSDLKAKGPAGAIEIDARNGEPDVTRTEFALRDRISVCVVNKNPFRDEYKLGIQATEVREPAIAAFLAFAKISTTSAPTDPTPATPPTPASTPSGSSSGPPSATSSTPEICGTLATNHLDLQKIMTPLKTGIEGQIKLHDAFTASLEPLQSQESDTEQLCRDAQKAIGAAAAFNPDPDSLKKQLKDLEDAIDAQSEGLDDKNVKKCDAAKVAEYKARLKAAKELYAWADQKRDELKTAKKEADALASAITETLQERDNFWECRYVGPFRVPTDVVITLQRKPLAAKDAAFKEIAKIDLNWGGGQRFFMAGGIASSFADRTRYAIIDGQVSGETKKMVGVEEDSAGRVSAAVLLHGIIIRPSKGFLDGVGLALGVGAAGSDDANIEFFTGLTASFANDNLFLTAGAFRGSDEKLADGYKVDDVVPDTLTALPTIERHSWTFGMALTFRIR